MRLIDAEYLLYGMGVFSEKENGTEFMKGVDAVAKMIDDAPTIAQSDWTPCADGLPRPQSQEALKASPRNGYKRKLYYITYRLNSTEPPQRTVALYVRPWRGATPRWYYERITREFPYEVLAWQLLPEPYNPDRKED